ncbi:hypothetical protein IO358_001351 [Campylobacter upsaliensis]|nr:hypothetical protein [Campylobacter upsaliensis]
MKDFDFLRKANLKGKIWLNAEHLGGCAFRFESCGGKLGAKQKGGEAFRFLLQTRGVFVTHRKVANASLEKLL